MLGAGSSCRPIPVERLSHISLMRERYEPFQKFLDQRVGKLAPVITACEYDVLAVIIAKTRRDLRARAAPVCEGPGDQDAVHARVRPDIARIGPSVG